MIHASDWREGLDWYSKAFPDAERIKVAEYVYEYLLIEGVALEVVQEDEKVPSGAAGSVVYWKTDNFDQKLRLLETLGAQLYRGPKEIEGGRRMCQVKDPFGNLIGLRET